jgi:hypothetical protein
MIPTPTPLAGETTEGEAGCEDFFSSLLAEERVGKKLGTRARTPVLARRHGRAPVRRERNKIR